MTPLKLAIYNHDGGCGKTTTANNLAQHLHNGGLRVLAIDLDPQNRLTERAGVTIFNNGIRDVMMGRNTINGARQVSRFGWDIIGTDIQLIETAALIQAKSPNHLYLRKKLQTATDYDIILIDCANGAEIIAVNMLYAVDAIIIPVKLDEDSASDIKRVMAMVAEMDEADRPAIFGCVLSSVNKNTVSYRTRKAEVEATGLTVLAEIPKYEGVNASECIFNAYAGLATLVRLEVENA